MKVLEKIEIPQDNVNDETVIIANIHVEENVLSSELGKFSVDIVNKFQEIYNQNNFFIR